MGTLLMCHGIYFGTIDYDLNAERVSTHHYNPEPEMDRLVEGLKETSKRTASCQRQARRSTTPAAKRSGLADAVSASPNRTAIRQVA